MRNKNAFTLIELLAVILILGIIALIAVPIIRNNIKNAEEESFKISINNIVRAAEQKCQSDILKGNATTTTYTFSESGITPALDIKGKLPTSGSITLDNQCNNTSINVSNGSFQAVLEDSNIKIQEGSGKPINNSGWTYNDKNTNNKVDVGDEITYKGEFFYIISNDGTNIKAITKYNLFVGYRVDLTGSYNIIRYGTEGTNAPTGMQDSTMVAQNSVNRDVIEGMSSLDYDENPGYIGQTFVAYNESEIKKYVDNYSNKLKELGANIKNSFIITKEELEGLGCKLTSTYDGSCSDAPDFIYSTSYWAYATYDGSPEYCYVFRPQASYSYRYDSELIPPGTRPVITISSSDIN